MPTQLYRILLILTDLAKFSWFCMDSHGPPVRFIAFHGLARHPMGGTASHGFLGACASSSGHVKTSGDLTNFWPGPWELLGSCKERAYARNVKEEISKERKGPCELLGRFKERAYARNVKEESSKERKGLCELLGSFTERAYTKNVKEESSKERKARSLLELPCFLIPSAMGSATAAPVATGPCKAAAQRMYNFYLDIRMNLGSVFF
jgi:hypothetical protein